MVTTSHVLTDSRLHETRQRWQDVDRWVDLSVVQLTIYVDLSFRDVTSKIRNRMGNIYRVAIIL